MPWGTLFSWGPIPDVGGSPRNLKVPQPKPPPKHSLLLAYLQPACPCYSEVMELITKGTYVQAVYTRQTIQRALARKTRDPLTL